MEETGPQSPGPVFDNREKQAPERQPLPQSQAATRRQTYHSQRRPCHRGCSIVLIAHLDENPVQQATGSALFLPQPMGLHLDQCSLTCLRSLYTFKNFFFFLFMAVPTIMEVPRPGVESELHVRPRPQPRQHQIPFTSVTCATAYGNARSLTH